MLRRELLTPCLRVELQMTLILLTSAILAALPLLVFHITSTWSTPAPDPLYIHSQGYAGQSDFYRDVKIYDGSSYTPPCVYHDVCVTFCGWNLCSTPKPCNPLNLNGNITLGDASTDTHTVTKLEK